MEVKFYGVDVSKDWLDVACDGQVVRIENRRSSIKSLVRKMPSGSFVALEATNTYHTAMADLCHNSRMRVFVINPRLTRRYREASGMRGKNDKMDALTLARYVEREHDDLREYVPLSADSRRLRCLVRRRWKLVGMRTQIQASFGTMEELGREVKALLARVDALIARLELLIDKQLEGNRGRSRIATITSVGPVVSAVLVSDLDAHEFASADAFVAYYGLDPIPNDSGKHKGKSKLSKQGQRLGRTMLYNAAISATASKAWKPIYTRCLERGMAKVQALIVLARKIARCAWSIHKHHATFDPARACPSLT